MKYCLFVIVELLKVDMMHISTFFVFIKKD